MTRVVSRTNGRQPESPTPVTLVKLARALAHPCVWLPARLLVGLAAIDAQEGNGTEAARLLGAIGAMRALGNLGVIPAHFQARFDRATALATAHLGETRFRRAWGAGYADRHGTIAAALGQDAGRRRGGANRLSPREREVLRLMADGMTDKAIGAALSVSTRTVSHHVAAILKKLDAESRTAAVAVALRDGLL